MHENNYWQRYWSECVLLFCLLGVGHTRCRCCLVAEWHHAPLSESGWAVLKTTHFFCVRYAFKLHCPLESACPQQWSLQHGLRHLQRQRQLIWLPPVRSPTSRLPRSVPSPQEYLLLWTCSSRPYSSEPFFLESGRLPVLFRDRSFVCFTRQRRRGAVTL